jgi:hypothetical protein
VRAYNQNSEVKWFEKAQKIKKYEANLNLKRRLNTGFQRRFLLKIIQR